MSVSNILTALVYSVSRYLHFENLEVLSLGCGKGDQIFELYQSTKALHYKIIVGVDNENSSLEKGAKKSNYYPINSSLQEEYEAWGFDVREASDGLFVYHVMDGLKFLRETNAKYDLIILSNFLHFFDKLTLIEYIKESIEHLKENGIVFIAMANHRHTYAHDPKMTTMDINLFNQLYSEYKIESWGGLHELDSITTWLTLQKKENYE